jgi:4-amino-4-deoxy-L-arabinose transferase-like glycosyltransferase
MLEHGTASRRWWILLAAVFLVALTVRGAAAWAFRHQPLGGDEIEYDALARGIVETGRYTRQPGFSTMLYSAEPGAPTSFRPPGWPFVLAGLYRTFGEAPMPARLALAAWNAAGCVLLILLLMRLSFDRRAALAAGVAWALWPASVWYPGTRSITLSTESLAIPILFVALLALAYVGSGRAATPLVAGVLLGCCALVRSNFSLLIPLAAAWILVATEGERRQRLRRAVLLLLGGALVVCPWMLRNRMLLGSFTIATQREPLFLGNNDWARGSYDSEFFNDLNSAQVAWIRARHDQFEKRSEVEKGRIYTREAVTYAREHPSRQAWLVGRRALLFMSPLREREDADNLFDWAFAPVGVLCLIGGVWAVKANPRGTSLLALPVLATFFTCLLVLFLPRYRYPAEPMLIAFACLGVSEGIVRHGAPMMLGLVGLLVAASVGLAVVMG